MSVRRLEDLRDSQSVDTTLQNLLSVLNDQLQLCSRLPVYEYEAAREAHEDGAAAFHALLVAEQAHVNDLLVALERHLALQRERAAAAADTAESAPPPPTEKSSSPEESRTPLYRPQGAST